MMKNGQPQLAEWRAKKLLKELEDLDGAEQYVLLARSNGMYPCYSCSEATSIYLQNGHIWKYGVTSKGQKGRYPDSFS